jgi:hypothetical protein
VRPLHPAEFFELCAREAPCSTPRVRQTRRHRRFSPFPTNPTRPSSSPSQEWFALQQSEQIPTFESLPRWQNRQIRYPFVSAIPASRRQRFRCDAIRCKDTGRFLEQSLRMSRSTWMFQLASPQPKYSFSRLSLPRPTPFAQNLQPRPHEFSAQRQNKSTNRCDLTIRASPQR